MAAHESDTNKGKSKFGLRPELVEAKERIYTEEKELNGPNAEAQEAARDIEEREEEERQGQTVYRTPKGGGNQADKSKGKGGDDIDEASVGGRRTNEPPTRDTKK